MQYPNIKWDKEMFYKHMIEVRLNFKIDTNYDILMDNTLMGYLYCPPELIDTYLALIKEVQERGRYLLFQTKPCYYDEKQKEITDSLKKLKGFNFSCPCLNEKGFHWRTCAMLVEYLKSIPNEVELQFNGKIANGKSLIEVSLLQVKKGDIVVYHIKDGEISSMNIVKKIKEIHTKFKMYDN